MRKGIAGALLTVLLTAGQAYAEDDTSTCPKVDEISASQFKTDQPHMSAPYDEGYEYDAVASDGARWHGETLATKDTFLEKKYELRIESVESQDKKIICRYMGTTVTHSDGSVSTPYLKLIREK